MTDDDSYHAFLEGYLQGASDALKPGQQEVLSEGQARRRFEAWRNQRRKAAR